MEFEFGTNWAVYSRFVGDVFGSALAAEGIFVWHGNYYALPLTERIVVSVFSPNDAVPEIVPLVNQFRHP